MNADGTGNITLPEFIILLEQCADIKGFSTTPGPDAKKTNNRIHEDDLRAAFIMLDEGGEGYVSVAHLENKLTEHGLRDAHTFLTRQGVHTDGCLIRTGDPTSSYALPACPSSSSCSCPSRRAWL